MKTIVLITALCFALPAMAAEAPQDTVLGPGPGSYRLASDDGTVVIPFEMFRNDIRMFAEVNGRPARLFIDNGYLDMYEVVRTLVEVGFDGLMIPDHWPELTGDSVGHAGLAYSIGYMRALLERASVAI